MNPMAAGSTAPQPVAPPKPIAEDTASLPESVAPLVLIAEDEEPQAEILVFVVREAGYTPLVALNGRQALAMAREQRPALLITDLMMPYLDGSELIAALRADAAASGETMPPAVLMTAANMAVARTAGADVVLRKPFHLADLEALLHRFLRPPHLPMRIDAPAAGATDLASGHLQNSQV